VSDDWISGKKKHDPIPERRPKEYYEKGYPVLWNRKEQRKRNGASLQVHRVRYLCAREERPTFADLQGEEGTV